MENTEELAQQALALLEQAERFEENKNWSKAIECYTTASEFLKRSGYLLHRIDDIYTRITELKNYLQQDKFLQQTQTQQQLEQLQDQAFALLDAAKRLETEAKFQEAIEQYMAAIGLLAQAGWSETQLENIKGKILVLADNLDQQKKLLEQRDIQHSQQYIQPDLAAQPQIMGAPVMSAADQKAAALKAFEEKKRREEQMQNEAFAHIDNAKMFEKEKNFDAAIANYMRSIDLLNQLGWTQQTENLYTVVQKLQRDKAEFEQAQAQQAQMQADQAAQPIEKPVLKPETELREFKLMDYEEKKRREEEIQTKAFNMIDIGKRLEREKKYEEAINQFKEAIELLKSIQWDSYIQPIVNFINDIKVKQQKQQKAEQESQQRWEKLDQIQQSITSKQKEQFVQTAQEMEIKRREFEAQKQLETQKEQAFLTVLDNADKILKQGKYEQAIQEYNKALEMLNTIPSWQSYVPTIQATLDSIQTLKESQSEKKLAEIKKQEERKKAELEFQEQMAQQLKLERERLQQRQIELQLRDDEMKYREKRKEQAFKFLDSAQNYIREGNFDKAIHAYQSAGTIFAEIQWIDEIPLIEESIKTLEEKKRQQQLLKQKELQESILRQKQEAEFQEALMKQMQAEREKLKQKEILLREREKELEYRESKKQEGFKILEEAQEYINQGDFDKALELYHKTINIFAEIQWHDEIELLQNSIIEIENKKRDAELWKQMELQAAIERQKQEAEFQASLMRQMEAESAKIQQREIILREREKELEYREKKKQEAFKELDKAQELLSQGKFDESLEIYHQVANTFAEIQWTEEIPLIQQAIIEIENKKRERDLWKQKSMQEAMQKEAAHQAFVEQLKNQRELEKAKLLEKKDVLAQQQEIMAKYAEKQKAAFDYIEEGDIYLKQEDYKNALDVYQKAIAILSEIGWEQGYLRVLKDSIQAIEYKKQEKEQEKLKEEQLKAQREQEEQLFQNRIAEQMKKEQARMKLKKIELEKKEALMQDLESKRMKAFELMDSAQELMNQKKYDESIAKYRKASLLLSEIQFPTEAISEMIKKIQDQKREEELAKQQELELQLKRQQEEFLFQQQITEKMRIEEQRMKAKKIQIQKLEERQKYMEKRKDEAFNLLDQAELFLKESQYDKSLQFYRSAEIILNEIQFSTEAVTEMIQKVEEKKHQEELRRQQELENKVHQKREAREYQQKVAEQMQKEKARMKLKQIQIQKLEEIQAKLEQRKEEAFIILDEAEASVKSADYDRALEKYRRAELILNEIQFPTGTIKEMIAKVINLKQQKENYEELQLQKELEQIEEKKALRAIIEERQREELEKKLAQQKALQERERIIQEQMSQRDAAYKMLEEGGKYIKRYPPDYDSAISLYIQARDILARSIGWEPEINNLNAIINDLQQEKIIFLARKKREQEEQLLRQEEYEIFQTELRKRRAEEEKQRQEQRAKFQQFEQQKLMTEQLQAEGLKMIDEGKRLTVHHEFEKAYKSFNDAIALFKEIGWDAQIKYIQSEIQNTKTVELRAKNEEMEMQRIQQELEKQKQIQEQKRLEEERTMRHTVGEIGNLADEITVLFEQKKEELKNLEKRKEDQIKHEAKEYSKNMGLMIKMKHELMEELKKKKEEEAKKQEEEQKKKERAEIDDIARMIREASKK
ncbi:MAG: hypothetical protein ACTSR8_05235 [Promethearchaeota archaeon]